MNDISQYLPRQINRGPFLTGYTLNTLHEQMGTERAVLPICSLGTPAGRLAELGPWVLPPLYHEALDDSLRGFLIEQIQRCFPTLGSANSARVQVVELDSSLGKPPAGAVEVLAVSVDTAVEQHGPHLPLATDTIQSYGVLAELAGVEPRLQIGPPAEYGHLTWGLPFGMSVDITPDGVQRYVRSFADALMDWAAPRALYVVDVHGSPVHRQAIQDGLAASRCQRWRFRWLYEPLVEFAGERGDQHAGGVETALVHHLNPKLVDASWWPAREAELAAGQMTMDHAIELSDDLDAFCRYAQQSGANGIVGDIGNLHQLDADLMFRRMVQLAKQDVAELV